MIKLQPPPKLNRTYTWEGPKTRFVGTLVKKEGVVMTFLLNGKRTRYLDDGRFYESTRTPEKEAANV